MTCLPLFTELPRRGLLGNASPKDGKKRVEALVRPSLRIQRKVSRLPALRAPPLEDSPSLAYGGHGLGIHPASVVKLRAEQFVQFLRCIYVHQEECPSLALNERGLNKRGTAADPLPSSSYPVLQGILHASSADPTSPPVDPDGVGNDA